MAEGLGSLTLVLGVDGSGKTTLINGLCEAGKYEVLEPTSTPEARAFKSAATDRLVDKAFVDERESLYLAVNSIFARQVRSKLETGVNVATTGSSLVTKVSHSLMRSIVGIDDVSTPVEVALRWMDGPDETIPEKIALVHAPARVILERIAERQRAGDTAERFWGFNAPHFLLRYQDTWLEVIDTLKEHSDINSMTLDTDVLSPKAVIDACLEGSTATP